MDNSFVDLTPQELEDINGGAAKFLRDYAIAKAIDLFVENRKEIWNSFKSGPSKDDPMYTTPYVQIFGK